MWARLGDVSRDKCSLQTCGCLVADSDSGDFHLHHPFQMSVVCVEMKLVFFDDLSWSTALTNVDACLRTLRVSTWRT